MTNIGTTESLASALADQARLLRDRIKELPELLNVATPNEQTPVSTLYQNCRHTLLSDLSVEDFADMCAQTIVYALFVSRCLNPDAEQFDQRHLYMPGSVSLLNEVLESFIVTADATLQEVMNETINIVYNTNIDLFLAR